MERQSVNAEMFQPVPSQRADGAWEFHRFSDVRSALTDPRFSSKDYMGAKATEQDRAVLSRVKERIGRFLHPPIAYSDEAIERLAGHWFVFMDAPDHSRIRGVVQAPFTARVRELAPKIHAHVEQLISEGARAGVMEVETALAIPLVTRVMGDILGLPAECVSELKGNPIEIASLLHRYSHSSTDSLAHSLAFLSIFERVIADKRKHRADDLISELITSQEEGVLDETELLAACLLLWLAGSDTLRRLIVLGTEIFLRHPAQFHRLSADRALMSQAVEELLRVVSPTRAVSRVATVDLVLGGMSLKEGQVASLCLRDANRDPRQFSEAEQFDIHVRRNQHLAFGLGPHICLGARLARLEAEGVFGSLATYASVLRLKDRPAQHPNSNAFGSQAELWVNFG